jgi:hypothetical protein
MDPLEINAQFADLFTGPPLAKIEPDSRAIVNSRRPFRFRRNRILAKPGAAAALAFDDLVALLQQALALAILALLLLFDIGALVIGHDHSPDDVTRDRKIIALTGGGILVYKRRRRPIGGFHLDPGA